MSNANFRSASCLRLTCVLLLVMQSLASAAVIYSDVDATLPFPVPTLPAHSLAIDFDGDSVAEFNITTLVFEVCACLPGDPQPPYFVASVTSGLGATDQKYLLTADSLDPSEPAALSIDQLIGPGNFVLDNGSTILETANGAIFLPPIHTGRGNFLPGTSIRYLGLEFEIASNTYYGWIGLTAGYGSSILDPGDLRIQGYAYDDTGAPILAGQTTEILFADGDLDQDVDGSDFLALQRDGISTAELAAWEAQFGSTLPPNNLVTVPEPSSLLMLAISMLAVVGHRRQRGMKASGLSVGPSITWNYDLKRFGFSPGHF